MVDYTAALQDFDRLFQLDPGGASYQAAEKIFEYIRQHAADEKPQSTGYLDEIQRAWREFYARHYQELKTREPSLLQTIGLLSPVVQITYVPGGLPRAYRTYPAIYQDEYGEKIFLYAPIDYKGESFTPCDASELHGEAIEKAGKELFGEGWFNPPAILPVPDYGTELPEDFDAAKHFARRSPYILGDAAVFIAAGRSREIVEEFKLLEEQFNALKNPSFDRPSLADYPQLLSDFPSANDSLTGAVPRLQTLRDRDVLIYDCAPNDSKFCPPDAIRLSSAVYQWVAGDETDIRLGRSPPPMPVVIAKEIGKTFGIDQIASFKKPSLARITAP